MKMTSDNCSNNKNKKKNSHLKLIRKSDKCKSLAIPERYRVESPFLKVSVDWKPVELSFRDDVAFALARMKAKVSALLDFVRNWRHEHIFLLSSSLFMTFVILYFAWAIFMHCNAQKTFKEEPSEEYGKCFNIWEVYH